jgi:hypothetical protein
MSKSAGRLDAQLRKIARKHARNAVAPIGSDKLTRDPIVAQEMIRAEEIIFYALKEAAESRLPAPTGGNPIISTTAPSLAGPDALAELKDFPNLQMMMAGCVSGNYTEWPLMRAELARLLRSRPADRDAERYRWLKKVNGYNDKFDAAIDAAMSQQGEGT